MLSREELEFLISINVIQKGQAESILNLMKQIEKAEANIRNISQQIVAINNANVATTKKETTAMREKTVAVNQLNKSFVAMKGNLATLNQASENTFLGMYRTIKRILTTMITLSSLFVFKRMIESGMTFEHEMMRTGAIIKATNTEFQYLVETVRKVSKETIYGATQVTGVTTTLGQAGLTAREIIESLEPILKTATATMGDLETVTSLGVAAIRSFNLDASKMKDVMNVMTEATVLSMATIQDLSFAFNYAGPAGAAFGQSLETTIATLAKFRDMGLMASTAGTTFRQGLIQLSNITPKGIKVLKDLNVSLDQVNPSFNDFGQVLETFARTSLTSTQALQLFGTRAGSAMFALIQRLRQGGEGISEFAKKLEESKSLSRVDEIYDKLAKSTKANTMIMKAQFEDLGLTIFQVFKPALVEIINNVKEAVSDLNDRMKKDTGKNLSETLVNLVPLLVTLSQGVLQFLGIVIKMALVIANLVSAFKPLGIILKEMIILYGLLTIKNILFNKQMYAVIGLMVNFGTVLARIVPAMVAYARTYGVITAVTTLFKIATMQATGAVVGLTVALKALLISTGIGIALVALTTLIGFLVEKLFSTKIASDEAAGSISQIGDSFGYSSEQIQKYSDQLGIVIESEEQLLDLQRQRRVFTSGGQAIGAGNIPLAEAVSTRTPEKAITFDNLTVGFRKSEEEISRLTTQYGNAVKAINKSSSNINLDVFLSFNDTFEQLVTNIRTIGDFTEPQALKFIENFLNKNDDLSKTVAKNMEDIWKFSQEGPGAVENKQALSEIQKMTKAMAESFKLKPTEDMQMIMATLISEMQKLKTIAGDVTEKGIAPFDKKFQGLVSTLDELDKQIQVNDESLKKLLKTGGAQGILKDNTSMIPVLNKQKDIDIAIGNITQETALTIEGIRRKLEANKDISKAEALILKTEEKTLESSLDRIINLNEKHKQTLLSIIKIREESELYNLLAEKSQAEAALEISIRQRISGEINRGNKLFASMVKGSIEFNKRMYDSGNAFSNIGLDFEKMKKGFAVQETVDQFKSITAELDEQSGMILLNLNISGV